MDSEQAFTPKDVLGINSAEALQSEVLEGYLDVGKVYWGIMHFKTKQDLKGWTLHFEDKMIGPPAWTKSNGRVDVYAYSGNTQIFHHKTGVEYSQEERAYKDNWIYNAVPLDQLPQNSEVTLVIRAQGNSIGYPAYFNLSARSPNQAYYHKFNQFHSGFNLFLFGVTFIIFLYHLLQFLYLKESIYGWFTLWLFFCAITQAMTNGFLLDFPSRGRYLVYLLFSHGIFYTFWFFGRSFIGSKQKFPRLDKVIMGLAFFMLFENVILALYVLIADPQTSFTGVGKHYVIMNAYTIVSLVVSIILITKKDQFARYFGIGSVVASIALIFGTLWSLAIMAPPFNLDPYATGIFLQIIIYSFGIAYQRQMTNKAYLEDRLTAERSRAEVIRMKDLDNLKSRFFTNISHEFRTPLTLIQGPLKQMKAKGDQVVINQRDYNIVRRNTDRLQNLVEELLELSSLESGEIQLILTEEEINSWLKNLLYSFESLAESSSIDYEVKVESPIRQMYFDKQKLEKVITNLVSNALKYTPQGGKVVAHASVINNSLDFKVSDTGKGIPENELPHVFDRFFRVEGSEQKGSGIGLAIVKELVGVLQGELRVSSTVGEGSQFSLLIPLRDAALASSTEALPTKGNNRKTEIPHEEIVRSNHHKESVLLVEDNPDLRTYIQGILANQYKVFVAHDGEEGIRLALDKIPDLIVSDVMMPKRNGFELCDTLKQNKLTSHIPLILLTAKAGQESKISGLTQGADVYLTKPFDAEELMLRIRNLMGLREKIWQKLKDTDGLLVEDLPFNALDNDFLKKVFNRINDRLDDSEFSVNLLAQEVGFSRAQLHRKIKSLLDKTPVELIAEVRLNKAYQLLEKKTATVSEVAYSVGYSNLSYFSKSFKNKFGKAPSEVLK